MIYSSIAVNATSVSCSSNLKDTFQLTVEVFFFHFRGPSPRFLQIIIYTYKLGISQINYKMPAPQYLITPLVFQNV